jgi:hypothetical protein
MRLRRGISSRLGYLVIALFATVAGCAPPARESAPQRLDFAHLEGADQLVVTGYNETWATITDEAKIRAALTFIAGRADGWVESWQGPRTGPIVLAFYKDGTHVGQFMLASTYVVVGGLHQDLPASEIAALVEQLGLEWRP